ncbi:membrane transporter [Kwoniella heveanensis BCC8398]|uniref:Membrane transporter n=1 Tax=Kwoniella heveanensis BCC8398 TaxID=1296120 RepID=A0A1B9GSI5_9TREE|nr:membrane transporter [Kwoniella heveanensis BCC8398]
MLPPPPASRQSSYVYPHGHQATSTGDGRPILSGPQAKHGHSRLASFRSAAESVLGLEHEVERETGGAGGYARSADDGEDEGDDDGLRQELEMEMGESGERGLEETLEKIGFGAYQWRLLALCGFGWMSDNSALQCIAVILPRVQVHFDLSSKVVGLLSASTMAGMMVGAVGWGVISDILGRALPFNSTLFLTALFGIAASFSTSFGMLCFWMFFLGSAVGGSMPTDGTLFLENLPHSKQYLLTLLSVFFSLGAVLSSVVSLVFLPGHSCRTYEGCDIAAGDNEGWRRVMFALGLFNLACSFARWFLFRLQESPRYLVSNGREQEAVVALQAIATYNSHSMDIQRADVQNTEAAPGSAMGSGGGGSSTSLPILMRDKKDSELPTPDPDYGQAQSDSAGLPLWSNENTSGSGQLSTIDSDTRYGGIGMHPPRTPQRHPIRTGSAFYHTPTTALDHDESGNTFDQSFANANGIEQEEREALVDGHIVDRDGEDHFQTMKRRGSGGSDTTWKSKPVEWWESWIRQMGKLFAPRWRRTVILMWIIWGSMSLAYTMFNVWLPSVLESKATGEGDEAIKEALSDYVLYSLAGCPGSLIGAWMIQTSLGRRKSLAICTIATSISTFAFVYVEAKWAVVVSSMVISGAATAMYAVLYGMTPETFGTSIRGTACGTSAALSRFTGVIAPVLAGFLLSVSPSLPVFTSAAVFCLTAGCSLALPFERVGGKAGRGGGGLMH